MSLHFAAESGETGSSGHECHEGSFICNDGSCIPPTAVCDGRADCPHDEDEILCRRGKLNLRNRHSRYSCIVFFHKELR